MYARTRALPTRPARPVWPFLLLALALLGLGWWAYRTLSAPRNPPVQAQATRGTPAQDWQTLKTFGPRPVGSAGHDRAADWLETQFTALGYRVTRQPVTFSRPYDLGGRLRAGGTSIPVQAIYGAAGGEQTGKLLYVKPDITLEELQEAGLQMNIALTSCPGPSWRAFAEDVMRTGAFGLVVIDDCPVAGRFQKVGATPLPLVRVQAQEKAKLLALVGQPVTLQSKVESRAVTGANLIAARVDAPPVVLVGAHLDTVNASPGANDNSSGVLSVLDAARRAVETPLAGQAWFVLFDAEEDGLLGSRAFVTGYAYPLKRTRAMLNLDMVGVAAAPLGVALDPQLLPLARRVRPQVRVFEEEAIGPKILGKFTPFSGRSDHLPFKEVYIPTAYLERGEDANYHTVTDRTLDPALVQDTADFTVKLAGEVLNAPQLDRKACGFAEKHC